MTTTVFTHTDPSVGTFSVRHVDPVGDTATLHQWLTHPKSAFWQMGHYTQDAVRQEFTEATHDPNRAAYLGLHRGHPVFLAERYEPAHSELRDLYPRAAGDAGMHFLVAPTDQPVRGFTKAVITTVMELLFASADVDRVVVEPDVENYAVHALNAAVGFRVLRTVALSDKDAYLSICTREQFHTATRTQGEPA